MAWTVQDEHPKGWKVENDTAPSRLATFGNGLVKGGAALLDAIPNGLVDVANLGMVGRGLLTGQDMSGYMLDHPNLANNAGHKLGLINDKKDPQDLVGKIVDMTGQVMGGGGIRPSVIANNVIKGKALPVVRDIAASVGSGTGAAIANDAALNVHTGSDALDRGIQATATLAGGAIPGGLLAARGTGGDRAAAGLKGVTPDQLNQADILAKKAAAAGTPITAYEAIQRVTGINPKMQTQQRVTMQSDASNNTLTPIMQARPNANAKLAEQVLSGISPKEQYPDVLAGQLQNSAISAIKSAQEDRTSAVSPFYQAQRNSDSQAMDLQDKIPEIQHKLADRLLSRDNAVQQQGQIMGLHNDMVQGSNNFYPVEGMPRISNRIAPHTDVATQAENAIPDFEQVAKQRLAEAEQHQNELNKTQDALAEKNIPAITSKVNSLLSNLDSQIRVAGPTIEGKYLQDFRNELSPNGKPIIYPSQLESIYRNNRNKLETGINTTPDDKTRAGVIGPQVKNLDNLIQTVSPDISQGRNLYSDISKNVVEPMQNSQVGKLAESNNFKNQANTLLPEAPMDVTPDVIQRTGDVIGSQDPTIVKRFIAQYLRGTYNESAQDNLGGPAIMGGSKFAAKVAGNQSQSDNLDAALKTAGVTDPSQFSNMMDIFRAQGYNPAPNSATASNASEMGLLNGKSLIDALMLRKEALRGPVDSWRNGWATEGLADSLSSGANTVKDISALARENGTYNPFKQQMMVNLLLANPSN